MACLWLTQDLNLHCSSARFSRARGRARAIPLLLRQPYNQRLRLCVVLYRIRISLYTAGRRYEFHFRVIKTIFYKQTQRGNYCFLHEKENYISSSHLTSLLSNTILLCTFEKCTYWSIFLITSTVS